MLELKSQNHKLMSMTFVNAILYAHSLFALVGTGIAFRNLKKKS